MNWPLNHFIADTFDRSFIKRNILGGKIAYSQIMKGLPSLEEWLSSMRICNQSRLWATEDGRVSFTKILGQGWYVDVNAEEEHEYIELFKIWENSLMIRRAFPTRKEAIQAAQLVFGASEIEINFGTLRKMSSALAELSTQYRIENTTLRIVQEGERWKIKADDYGYWKDQNGMPFFFSSRQKAAISIYNHLKDQKDFVYKPKKENKLI